LVRLVWRVVVQAGGCEGIDVDGAGTATGVRVVVNTIILIRLIAVASRVVFIQLELPGGIGYLVIETFVGRVARRSIRAAVTHGIAILRL